MIFYIVLSILVAASSIVDSVPLLVPQSLTVNVNDPVVFNCSGDNSSNSSRLDWFFIRNASLTDSQYANASFCVAGQSTPVCVEVTSYGEIKKTFENVSKLIPSTRNGTKESYLSIPKADMQHAGVYVCNAGFGKMLQSFLSVIDPLPQCGESSYNHTTDEISITCNFKYFGVIANLQWSSGDSDIRNNCSGEREKFSCGIRITKISDDNCDLSQCVNKHQCHQFTSGNKHLTCIWGVNKTTDRQTDENSYVFHLETRSFAFIRCFKGSCQSTTDTTTPGLGNNYISDTTKTVIALAVTCSVVLLVILCLVLLIKRGSQLKDKPTMTTFDGLSTGESTDYTEATYSRPEELTEEESSPVYGNVRKPKAGKSAPVYAEVKPKGRKKGKADCSANDTCIYDNTTYAVKDNCPANDNCIYDNTTYADVVPPQHIPKRHTDTSRNEDHDGNNVVYEELGRAPPTFRIWENRAPAPSDDQLEISNYAMIDHAFSAPPPPSQTKSNQRR